MNHGSRIRWYESGKVKDQNIYNKGKRISKKEFNIDGTLNKKEYYDSKCKFLKRELFENGKVVEVEVED